MLDTEYIRLVDKLLRISERKLSNLKNSSSLASANAKKIKAIRIDLAEFRMANNQLKKTIRSRIDYHLEELHRTTSSCLPLDPVNALQILINVKRGKSVSDCQFDAILPEQVRQFSGRHWTPIEVAIRAAELLVPSPAKRVLDVGSGPGKFCIIGALTTDGIFIGVEQRRKFIEVAKSTVNALGISRASFVHGNMGDIEWAHFDSFYLFNPFYENVDPTAQIDQRVALGEEHFVHYISVVEEKLKKLRSGTRVVTYHGFGGTFPDSYRCALKEPCGNDYLELWVKEPEPNETSLGNKPSVTIVSDPDES